MLPTQVAEPNKTTANTYSSKGLLTGQSWTATTDTTGAAKFTAVKTGSTYATGWSYSASSLATTVIEKVDEVETKRWTMAYATNGDLTRVTDVTGGNRIGRSTAYDVHGRVLTATEVSGRAVAMTYTPRGSLASEAYGGSAPTTHEYNSLGFRTKTTTVHGDVSEFRYDAAHRVIDVLHNGKSLSDPSIGLTSAQPLWQRALAWMGSVFVADAHAHLHRAGPASGQTHRCLRVCSTPVQVSSIAGCKTKVAAEAANEIHRANAAGIAIATRAATPTTRSIEGGFKRKTTRRRHTKTRCRGPSASRTATSRPCLRWTT
jgi:YD repeat-containing protein